ncbi:MAG: RluA family pseudouridine synthase [Oscillospiraceae bacterium]|nr:RluA family pseudouridine synthase [Oscillospiraceae bacterium]
MSHIYVTARESGERIDALLAYSGFTRSAAAKLIAAGRVTRAGRPVKKSDLTLKGDVFLVDAPDEPAPTAAEPQDIPLDVVFEDEDVIVVNKPRGLVVHPAPGHPDGTLVNALLYHCGDSLSGVGGTLRPGIVHRLDRDTSGLIIAAKNDAAHLSLSSQLGDRSLSRVYEAVVHGSFKADSGTVDAPIGRHPVDRKRMAVTDKNSRAAVTDWEVVDRYRGFTHVRCILRTGRTHQIRVHMAHIGHPLLGDLVYGVGKPEKGLSGQCLHARQLKFRHPRTGEQISLTTELPAYFTEVLSRLGNKLG